MRTAPSVLGGRDAPASPRERPDAVELEALSHCIERAGHYLPAQGPITVFIHHNTLHAFEDYNFFEGVERGAKLFGCQPYLTEDRYRQELSRGRIRPDDLSAALLEDLGDAADSLIGFMGTRFHFRQAMLQYPLQTAPAAELRWFVAETDALTRFRRDAPAEVRRRFLEETRHWVLRDHRNGKSTALERPTLEADNRSRQTHVALATLIDHFGRGSIERWSEATWEAFTLQALWRICREGVHRVKATPHPQPHPIRHRDLLLEATGEDTDILVNSLLTRFCAAFLDQGLSCWPLPERDRGFLASFCAVYRQPGGPPDSWLRELPAELAAVEDSRLSAVTIIHESLADLGVSKQERDDFLTATLLALRGWAGMVRQLELRGDRVAHPVPPGSLVELLAVRLILERLALAHVARGSAGFTAPLAHLRLFLEENNPRHETAGVDQRAFQVFQLAQVLGWLPPMLAQLSQREWAMLVAENEAFPALARRRVFQMAYERRYRNQTLDAIAEQSRQPAVRVKHPSFQVSCCLDEREESFRRHLEEVAPRVETFGAAGFYGVAIYYRGAADAHFVPLCPVIIRPQHWVVEEVASSRAFDHRRRAQTRRTLGAASRRLHLGSRSFLGGALVAGGLGVLASIPLVARVLFPRLTARLRSNAGRFVGPPTETILQIERTHPTPGAEPGRLGYSIEEMSAIVKRQLADIGLTSGFARLVFIFGHGSVSLNNPHESAHDCGACGGGRGGPNARAFARMANDPRVRKILAAQGLTIPDDTIFVGGYHNTCDESLTCFDLDGVPESHQAELASARCALDQARMRNAHERCRRFESAPLSLTPDAALRHVEARAEDLAQVRPEYGHATNAVCFVGRRSRTRGLYMDRRTFLTSYDPTQDDAESTILTRILQAAVPVCGGISLEYFFSYVDNTGYGCGTKLPHNIASLLGVMDGHASDLRAGLPWQMVEIHEPMRELFVIETTPDALLRIMDRNPGIGRLCRKGWVQVATLDPSSSQIHLFTQDRFVPYQPESNELPRVDSSIDWYRGWRDHLGFAVIRPSA